MPEKNVELPADAAGASAVLNALLQELDWGVILFLREDSKKAYEFAAPNMSPSFMRGTAVFAPDISVVRPLIEPLSGSDQVNWSDLGSRVVGIGFNDSVVVTLGRSEAQNQLDVLFALLAACGGIK